MNATGTMEIDSGLGTSARRKKDRGESAYSQKLKARQAACQVDGCNTAVPNKAYHQRYKICQPHAAMPQMVLEGRHVRFCQHCGRFQALQEFDGAFKSCRKSLERHRKSQSRRIKSKGAKSSSSFNSGGSDDPSSTAGLPKEGSLPLPSMQRMGSHGTRDCTNCSSDASGSPVEAQNNGGGHHGRARSSDNDQQQTSGTATSHEAIFTTIHASQHGGPPTGAYHAAANPPGNAAATGAGGSDPFLLQLERGVFDFPVDTIYDADTDWMADMVAVEDIDPMASEPMPLPLPPVIGLPQHPTVHPAVHPAVRQHQATAGAHLVGTLDAALNLLCADIHATAGAATAGYDHPTIVRASLKLFDATPDQLPSTVRDALQGIMAASATYLATNARPGCTHLTAEALLTALEAARLRESGASGFLQAALASAVPLIPGAGPSTSNPRGPLMAQLDHQVAALGEEGGLACVAIDPVSPTSAHLLAIVPIAVLPGSTDPLVLLGRGIAGSHDMVVCRREDEVPVLGVLSSGPVSRFGSPVVPPQGYTARGMAGGEYVQVELMRLKEGLHSVEVQKGSLLSPTVPFLVMDNAAAVAELRQLEADAGGVSNVPAFVQSVGVVLEHLRLRAQSPRHPNASPAAAARISDLARRLVVVCTARGWPAMTRSLLEAALSPAAREEELAEEERGVLYRDDGGNTADGGGGGAAANTTTGTTLLHLAVASGCPAVVDALREWGSRVGYQWQCQPCGPAAITPLHLAALLDDGGEMARALTALLGVEPARSAWHQARGTDGLSPAKLAKVACNEPVLEMLTYELLARVASPEGVASGVAATACCEDAAACNSAAAEGVPLVPAAAGKGAKSAGPARDEDSDVWPFRSLGADHPLRGIVVAATSMEYRVGATLSMLMAALAVVVRLFWGRI